MLRRRILDADFHLIFGAVSPVAYTCLPCGRAVILAAIRAARDMTARLDWRRANISNDADARIF